MRRTKMICAALCCFLCLPMVAAPANKSSQQEQVSTVNSLGVYFLAGYDNMIKPASGLRNIGGPMGGLGFGYQLQHGTYSRGAFLLNIGLEAQYGLNIRKGSFDITKRVIVPSEDLFYAYQFRNLTEKQRALDMALSVMAGGKFKGVFFLAGARLGYPLSAGYTIQSDVNRTVYDAKAIDYYTDMPNHSLSSGLVKGEGRMAHRFAPQLSFEAGYDFHKPSAEKKDTKGRGRKKAPKTFKDYAHCQLSAFVNIGLMDYKPEQSHNLVGFDNTSVTDICSTSEAAEFASARTVPIYAGVKFALLFELPDHKKQKKQDQPNPYIVTYVQDEATGKHLSGATVTTQAVPVGKIKKKPVVKTTDSKYGRVTKTYAPGDYLISAVCKGYIPQEPFRFTHGEENDTVRIALYPQRPLRSQVIDARTGRPVTAQVTVMVESGDTIIKSTLDSAVQVLSLMVDDRKHFSVCASAEGYRDTCVNVTDIAENIVRLEPIQVRRFVLKNMFFATDKTKILSSSEPALQELYKLLSDNPDIRIRIIGHTDDVGKDDYNQRLSEGRSKSVKQEMVNRGIKPERIETAGHGEKDPIVPNDSDEHRQMNRRVEIEIISDIVGNIILNDQQNR